MLAKSLLAIFVLPSSSLEDDSPMAKNLRTALADHADNATLLGAALIISKMYFREENFRFGGTFVGYCRNQQNQALNIWEHVGAL